MDERNLRAADMVIATHISSGTRVTTIDVFNIIASGIAFIAFGITGLLGQSAIFSWGHIETNEDLSLSIVRQERDKLLVTMDAAEAALRFSKAMASDRLPWLGDKRSWPMLRRTVRAAEKAAGRLSLKRLAPATGPRTLRVALEEPDGTRRVIYEG